MSTNYQLTFDMSDLSYSSACYLTVRLSERLGIPVEDDRMYKQENPDGGWFWEIRLGADTLADAVDKVTASVPTNVRLLNVEVAK